MKFRLEPATSTAHSTPKEPALMLKRQTPQQRTSPSGKAAPYLETAHTLADLAGAKVLPYFRKPVRIDNKDITGSFDPVTTADTAAERAMRKLLATTHPEHGIVGEEFADTKGASEFRWVLDPIDGTRAFIMGYPLWGILVGLLEGNTPILGIMDQPYTRERFWSDGKKSEVRDSSGKIRRMKTRPCPDFSKATLASTSPDLFATSAEKAAFNRISAKVRLTRYGGDCYAYCLLAAGHIDIIVEAGLKAVDIVALIPIIEAAGGCVTTWDGKPAINGGRIVATGDARLHAAALELLAMK
jgi:histidinol phosphatase-like enzyme (inositol monophosphatase family)